MADRKRCGEAGFSLIEAVICIALLACGCVAALAAFPPLIRNAEAGIVRAAATSIARNAIERVRAAVAYDPPGAVLDPATRAATTANHAWALAATSTYRTTARFSRSLCGTASATTDVPMTVTTTYAASADMLTVTVQYPRSPCVPSNLTSVSLATPLAPAADAPQTTLRTGVADPERQ
jgi:Tfp pilus assembly protein PilV